MTESASIIKAEVAKIKEAAEVLVKEISVETEKANIQLERALPSLQEAEAALNVCSFPLKLFLLRKHKFCMISFHSRPLNPLISPQ